MDEGRIASLNWSFSNKHCVWTWTNSVRW